MEKMELVVATKILHTHSRKAAKTGVKLIETWQDKSSNTLIQELKHVSLDTATVPRRNSLNEVGWLVAS